MKSRYILGALFALFSSSCAQHIDGITLLQSSSTKSKSSRLVFHEDNGEKATQSVHWIFTTDCTAYMFNQGNILLASAFHVKQPGNFTWIMSGCTKDEQKKELRKLAHPRARVFHVPVIELVDPATGKPYPAFQASNRPTSIAAWFQAQPPSEEAIAIIDPDEIFLRPVYFKENPRQGDYNGPWQAPSVSPKHAGGAYYGIGCLLQRWNDDQIKQICTVDTQKCLQHKKELHQECVDTASSGPPWVLHKSDATELFGAWEGAAVTLHKIWDDIFSEQGAYGISAIQYGIKHKLDAFWFLSQPRDPPQQRLWDTVAEAQRSSGYNPCSARAPPPADTNLPIFWHSTGTYEIPHLEHQGYRLHKDHIHKDILDCNAPLLRFPPTDALDRYSDWSQSSTPSNEWRQTWIVCTYTNLVNFYATKFKEQYCPADQVNLDASFVYPDHAQLFQSQESHIAQIFRPGGWADASYKVSFNKK